VDVHDPKHTVRLWTDGQRDIYDLDLSANRLFTAGGYGGFTFNVLDITDAAKPQSITAIPRNPSNPIPLVTVDVSQPYAYVTATGSTSSDPSSRIKILDLNNISSLPAVAEIPNVSFGALSGNFLYANRQSLAEYASDGSDPGFTVFDVTDPRNAQPIGRYDADGRIQQMIVSNNYAYLATIRHIPFPNSTNTISKLEIVDVSNAQNPHRIGVLSDSLLKQAVDVAVAGGYAYLTDAISGLHVISVQDPGNPRRIARYETAGYARDVVMSSQYAYIADETAGFQIIDLARPEPVRIGLYKMAGTANRVKTAGKYAYLLGIDPAPGLHILDISDPTAPRKIGLFESSDVPNAIALNGEFAYLVLSDKRLQIISLKNPESPIALGTFTTDGVPEDLILLDRYAYLALGPVGIEVIDLGDPARPRRVRTIKTPGRAQALVSSGEYLYIADTESGLQVLDLHDRESPARVTSYPTRGEAVAIARRDNYLFLSDRNIYLYNSIATNGYGVAVFDISNPADPRWMANYPFHDQVEAIAVSDSFVAVARGLGGLDFLNLNPTEDRPDAPILGARAAEERLDLSWRTEGLSYKVQWTSALGSAASWTEINTFVLSGTNQCSVKIETSEQARFYRLIQD
jgi:hypothetical protein